MINAIAVLRGAAFCSLLLFPGAQAKDTPIQPPTVQIRREGTNVVISWTTNSPGYQVDHASKAGAFQPLNVPIILDTARRQFAVIVPATDPNKIFRLNLQ